MNEHKCTKGEGGPGNEIYVTPLAALSLEQAPSLHSPPLLPTLLPCILFIECQRWALPMEFRYSDSYRTK
jgi:hypothetical protein